MIVVDASAALSRLMPGQSTPATLAFFAGALPELVAPAIFPLEVRNALLRAERHGSMSADLTDLACIELAEVVTIRPWAASVKVFMRLTALARRERLSLFDAAYLDLALREGAALASRDGPLIAAARRSGLSVHDLR